MHTIESLIRHADIDKREAEMILAHVLDISRATLIAHPERSLDETQVMQVNDMLSRRAAGEPIAYIFAEREFYGEIFLVNRHVLIPRPETELLVEEALTRLHQHSSSHAPTVLDLGTGSGVIAIMLAKLYATARITAVDISPDALRVAQHNAQKHQVDIQWLESNWYSQLDEQMFDVIVANPPYIAPGDPHLSQGDLRYEPVQALTDGVAGQLGLAAIQKIINGATARLNSAGWLLFEHGYDQAEAARDLLTRQQFTNVFTVPDLAGIPRISGGQWFSS